MKHPYSLFALILFFFLSCGAAAQVPNTDEYVVQFKDTAERIVPPYDWTRPVVAASASPEVKAAIAQALSLNGEVLGIYPRLNGILARMSIEESERVRADPRVESVQRAPRDQENPRPPNFRNNPQMVSSGKYSLEIPLVDYNGIPGLYQNAKIEYLPQDGSWRLAAFQQASPVRDIASVEVIVTDEVPAQVFFKIRGNTRGCEEVGEVGMKKAGEVFTVYLFHYPGAFDGCIETAYVRPFLKVVPLNAYGLRAGKYYWTLNGNISGSFTLAADNVLP